MSRTVVEVSPKFHPEGKRFLVKPYPKGKRYRRFKLSPQIVDKLGAHLRTAGLGSDDLLFHAPAPDRPKSRQRGSPDPETLGWTEPNDRGRQYRHGTLSAYNAGTCRCQHCKDAYAVYRAQRRSQGKDSPRTPRTLDTDGHVPNNWFRNQVWKPALAAAGVQVQVRFHDLRHAHASWLLAGGADLQVVKERLGHANIATTAGYLHTLQEADDSALDALASVRRRSAGAALGS